MEYKGKQLAVTNTDLLKYKNELADVAGTVGVHTLGVVDPQAEDDACMINIAVGMPMKSRAEEVVKDVSRLMDEVVPDNKFRFYPAGSMFIRDNLTVLYDGRLLYG